MLLHEFSEIILVDVLRLLLRPFLDKSRAVVPTWPAQYCNQFLPVHIWTVGRTPGGMTNSEVSSLCKKVSTKYTIYISDVYVRIEKHARLGGFGGMLLHEIFRDHSSRCSEIASEAILGQKQICSTYIACIVL